MNDTRKPGDEPADSVASPTLCFIVDDEPAIGQFISMALRASGIGAEQFIDIPSMLERLGECSPDLIFLDISLGDDDAIDAIRGLAARSYGGGVALMSGHAAAFLEDVRTIGNRYGLTMLPVLTKPFRLEAVRQSVEAVRNLQKSTPSELPENPGRFVPRVELGEALGQGWVEIWYQPKLHLDKRHLVGAEGLARVRHPALGLLTPESFIPGASDASLIALAEHALKTAIRDAAEFARMGRVLRLAINVPVEALLALPIASIVRQARRENQEWHGIILEVTEDQIVRDIPLAHEIATQLRIHGVALALDDFGSGYSSLARLAELPFAELKLDMSLVADCSNDTARMELCRMVIELAHRFGCQAVAEGIEHTADLEAIRRVGCDVGQGYIFARPMPKEFLATRLVANAPDGGFASIIELSEREERAIA